MTRRLLILGVFLVLGFIAWRHLWNVPVNPRSDTEVNVEIPSGVGVREAARLLKAAGVLRSPLGFALRAIIAREHHRLQAGAYLFRPRESGAEILRRLVAGDSSPTDVAVTIPEGFTLAQIADRLDANKIATREAFRAAAVVESFRSAMSFLSSAPVQASLEGYLFPDTYRFKSNTPPEDVIRRLLSRFQEQWEKVRSLTCETGAKSASGYCPPDDASVHALVTMASIVEREVRSTEDRQLVAGILWKRYNAGLGLDADATIRFALDNWDRPLTVQDLQTDSPYNTRRFRGLPPGPIGNPGLDTLRAVLAPRDSSYLYYLSAPDGRTVFSETLEQHNQAKATYLR